MDARRPNGRISENNDLRQRAAHGNSGARTDEPFQDGRECINRRSSGSNHMSRWILDTSSSRAGPADGPLATGRNQSLSPYTPGPVSQRPALGCLVEVIETLVLTVIIFFGIQAFVAQPFKVQQGSMENTLIPEQYVLVDKLSPRWDAYSYGDIIVFRPPIAGTRGPRCRSSSASSGCPATP